MRRVVSLVAFGGMLLCAGYISDVSAARSFNQLRMEQLKKDPKVKEYIKLLKKQEEAKANQSEVQENSEDESDNSVSKTKKKTTNRKKTRNKKKNRKNKSKQVQTEQTDEMD